MFRFSKHSGFSLIELMVVMGIMAVLMGLTGGLVTKTVDQQTRMVELEKIQHYFKLLSYRAYYTGSPIVVTVDGDSLIINENEKITKVEFEQLVFIKSTFDIQTTAAISPNTFAVIWNDNKKEFKINAMFKQYESQ